MEDISSPFNGHFFDLCYPDIFSGALQNSEDSTSPNCCYNDNPSYMSNLEFAPTDIVRFPNITDSSSMTLAADMTATTPTTTTTMPANIPSNIDNNNNNHDDNNNNNNIDINNINDVSIIFDSAEEEVQNDISASIDFSSATQFHLPPSLDPHQQNNFDPSSLQSHHQLQVQQYHSDHQSIVPLLGLPLSSVFEDDCLPLVPPYNIRSNPSCSSASGSFLDASTGSYQLQSNLGSTMSAENAAIFHGNMFVGGTDIHNQDLDFHGENSGIFCTDPLSRIFNSNELQGMNSESQHLVSAIGNSTGLASDLTSLDDSTFKVGKISAEQRKEKIHRYMKKRNERNFSKKIKYACRKTLADSRPRVRGRFAKNDEFGEVSRATCGSLEDDNCEDHATSCGGGEVEDPFLWTSQGSTFVSNQLSNDHLQPPRKAQKVAVKEEEEMVDSSDIFAHISGVNSLKCNYSIQSWI